MKMLIVYQFRWSFLTGKSVQKRKQCSTSHQQAGDFAIIRIMLQFYFFCLSPQCVSLSELFILMFVFIIKRHMAVVGVFHLSVVKAAYCLWMWNKLSEIQALKQKKREKTTFHVSWSACRLSVNVSVNLITTAVWSRLVSSFTGRVAEWWTLDTSVLMKHSQQFTERWYIHRLLPLKGVENSWSPQRCQRRTN